MMLEFRQLLQAKLDELVSQPVYFKRAPMPASFPYVVYALPNQPFDGEYIEQGTLEVDGWDDDRNTAVLEAMMAQVSLLDKIVLVGTNFRVVLYKDAILYIDDDDPDINRIKYSFTYKIYRGDY